MRYIGVSRSEFFSPNRKEGDSAVFHAVASELGHFGHEVVCMTEQELVMNGLPCDADGFFQMARSREALDMLGGAKVPVTNTVQAVLNCTRVRQTELLKDSGLIPLSVICSTAGVPAGWDRFPCWIKRPDSHAVEKDDVQFIQNAYELETAIRGYAERGIKEFVIQDHVKGWLVKFYGVKGFGLVDCYAATAKDGKFGLEKYNDTPDTACVDMKVLAAVAERASDLLGLDVYGGDAVVGDDGIITIVDFNDWPSFRTCTVGAAQKIAELIISKNR